MSNKIILRHLARLLEEARIYHKVFDQSNLHEKHRLVTFVEKKLSQHFSLIGSVNHCPDLERKIEEAKKNDPEEFRKLIHQLVKEFYAPLKLPFQRVPEPEWLKPKPPPWLNKEKKREVEVVV